MLTFEQALDKVSNTEDKSVLLGNGFSQAWNADIFNYQNLFQAADFGDQNNAIRGVFDRIGTYDFEIKTGS